MEINLEQILKLKEDQIKKMAFNDIMAGIKLIDDYFRTGESKLDVEAALRAYQKAVQLLTAARTKLINFENEKEKIDREYEEFMVSLSGRTNSQEKENSLEEESGDSIDAETNTMF